MKEDVRRTRYQKRADRTVAEARTQSDGGAWRWRHLLGRKHKSKQPFTAEAPGATAEAASITRVDRVMQQERHDRTAHVGLVRAETMPMTLKLGGSQTPGTPGSLPVPLLTSMSAPGLSSENGRSVCLTPSVNTEEDEE